MNTKQIDLGQSDGSNADYNISGKYQAEYDNCLAKYKDEIENTVIGVDYQGNEFKANLENIRYTLNSEIPKLKSRIEKQLPTLHYLKNQIDREKEMNGNPHIDEETARQQGLDILSTNLQKLNKRKATVEYQRDILLAEYQAKVSFFKFIFKEDYKPYRSNRVSYQNKTSPEKKLSFRKRQLDMVDKFWSSNPDVPSVIEGSEIIPAIIK